MHRIDTPTAQKDKFGQGKNGFSNGDPTTGTPSTGLDEAMFDALQEEVCTVIERSGIKLNKDQHDQLYKAIRKLSTEDLSKALLKAQNLADLPDKGAARSHLEVYSQSQTDGKYFPKTGGTVNGPLTVEGNQLVLKGDDRKHLGFHNQDGSVRMWLYKDKSGDGVRLNNGNDGGGDWVFNKNGHFYSPQALHAAGATYQEDGNVHGAVWGGHLSGWLNNTFVRDIRLGGLESVMAWNGPGYVDQGGYVLTGAENGNRDAYIDRIYRRPLQKNINGNWMNVGSI